MIHPYTVALCQYDVPKNRDLAIEKALSFCQRAIARGAQFIVLPELCTTKIARDPEPIPGPSTLPFMTLANQHGTAIVVNLYEKTNDQTKGYNTSVLIDHHGAITATYRKNNLFYYPPHIDESNRFVAGTHPTIGHLGNVSIGMTVCFDLRFSDLFAHYAKHAVHFITIPSAFIAATGEAHWHTLVRCRAIETQAFVLAPNQVGHHNNTTALYGHSLIVDPWGTVIQAATKTDETILQATVDIALCDQVRKRLPTYVVEGAGFEPT